MGRIHTELVNEGRGCHEWYNISFSEIETVKSLIKNRLEFDKCYDCKRFGNNNPYETNGVPEFIEPIIVACLDLEQLIKDTYLTKNQLFIVQKLMDGYNEKDISEEYNISINSIKNTFDKACFRIVEENNKQWIDWTETSGLVKISDEVKYKQCSKCGEWFIACEDNFAPNKYGQYGLRSICRKCRE
jgi:hypothetical protein